MLARALLCSAALTLLSWPSATGQALRGRLLDDATGAAIRGAQVVMRGANRREVRSTTTDSAGIFNLPAPKLGSYTLLISHIAYSPYASSAIPLNRNEVAHVTIRLSTTAIPLQPLVVTARRPLTSGGLEEFERRRRNPALWGQYVTAEEIDRRPTATVTMLLRPLAGVRLDRIGRGEQYIVRFRGTSAEPCAANVFVNGMYVPQSEQSTVDDWLDVSILAGVEVYSASLAPVQYQRTQCGVVLFWTKEGQRFQPPSSGRLRYIIAGVAAAGILFAFLGN